MNKLFTKIVGAALGLTMAIGVGVAVASNSKEPSRADAAAGDIKSTISASAASSTTYARYEVTDTGDSRSVGWVLGWASSNGRLGANKATTHNNIKPTAADLPVVKAVYASATTSTTGYYFYYTTTALTNVASLEFYTGTIGKGSTTTGLGYVVTSTTAASSGSANWSKVTLSSSSTSTQGSTVIGANSTTYTFTFNSTNTSSAYYGIVINASAYINWNGGTITLKEGAVSQTPSVAFDNPTTTVGIGQSITNTATGQNLGGNSISYAASSVSPAGCITLNTSTGQVTGNAVGTARITASATVSGVTYSDYYDITVSELPIYDEEFSDWTWSDKGTAIADRLVGADDSHLWRMSVGEYFSTTYLLGDYNTGVSAWATFSATKYYSSIAAVLDTNSYGVAMYSQNFSFNKPSKVTFSWTAVSGLGATNKAYIIASTNGGYSWSVLANETTLGTNMSVSWEANTYASTDNVILGLAFTASQQNPQLRGVSIEIFAKGISTTNVWAVREITVTGNANVEAEQTTTYTATVVTTGYETPANSNITWSSGVTSVATVNSSGVVTGVSVGSASIIATAADGNGASGSKTITVTEKLKRLGTITLNTDNVTKSFVRNSAFNSTGLVVTAHYANGFDDETVTPASVTAPDMTTAGNNKTVTVTYSVNGTSANATYTIDVTPIVSDTITISGTGVSLVDGRYKITTGPNYMDTLSVTYNGDESEITATPTNESIYYKDGYLMVESTDNDSGTITFTVGNATAYLDVTVIADETLDYVTPADGIISCVQHQTIGFEFSLVNASEGEWTEPTSSAYTITGTGDETGYIGEITLNEVCTNLEAEFSVETSKDTLTISLYLTASADSITSISVKTNPTKTTYVVGETFSSAGLVVSANRTSGVSRDLASNEINIRNAPTVLNERGSKTITVELVVDTSKTTSFTITVNMPSGLKIVTKTSNHDGGFEGTIIESEDDLVDGLKVTIGNGDSNDATLIGKWSSGNNIPEVSGDGVSVSDGVYSFTNSNCVYTLEASDSHWKLVDADGRYIYAAGGTGKNNHLKAVAPASVTDNTPVEWDITIDNGETTIVCADSSVVRNTLMYNNGSSIYSCYASGQTAIHLYSVTELEPTYSYNSIDLSVTIYDFIRAVYNNSDYYTCNNSGIGSSLTNWNNAATDTTYAALTPTDKENLAYAVVRSPDGTKESCQLVADYLSQYDYVVAKYGENYDYLGRVDAGTAVVNKSHTILLGIIGANTNTVAIIVVVSMISVAAVGGYFLFRRRKEQ